MFLSTASHKYGGGNIVPITPRKKTHAGGTLSFTAPVVNGTAAAKEDAMHLMPGRARGPARWPAIIVIR